MKGCIVRPIAIIGAACRLPGDANSLDSLWNLLEQGRDAVRPLDGSRWNFSRFHHPRRDMPGRTVAPRAGLIDGVHDFDPAFFGISRTEAMSMDPQQRIMLELAWEALEDAGIPPSSVSGTDTAVFVGAASPDAGTSHSDDVCVTTPYSMTGTNLSIISNRISYIYNFHGPSMTIDTACSSAMYALHQACQALVSGQAQMAMVGGVNVLLSPFPFVGFSQAHMLSPDGICKVFDASGDGYVRAEGAGLVLIQPLEEALAQGRQIHAVIRACGCNCDGRTQGIALPSGEAQEELLRSVYDAAGLGVERLAYVEAHGTGTAAGDPVEAGAIGRALAQGRADPLWVGSVKCSVGHLETASAMAGLMKALAVLRTRRIPPQIHLKKLNPAIDCRGLNLRFPLRIQRLPRTEGLPLVGVNSFGFGGANGHVLLEAAQPAPRRRTCHAVPPLFLTASSEESLQALAAGYADAIEQNPQAYYDIAAGAAQRRDMLARRLCAEGGTPQAVAEALRQASAESAPAGLALGEVQAKAPADARARTAFVFTGNGSQWAGMGRAMLDNPAFAGKAQEVSDLLRELSGEDLLERLKTATPEDMAHTDTSQKLLFLVQAGLCAALEAAGLAADCAFGHSVGEVAAAWYCGALSLKEAVRVIHYRSCHQERTRGTGRMAAASIAPAEAETLAQRFGDVELAGINAADAVTLSGSAEALAAVGRDLKARRVFFKELPLDYAFHSTRMDAVREGLLGDLKGLRTRAPRRLFISTVTGALQDRGCPAGYWWENVRRPVQFHGAVQTAISLGVRHFLELGPHSILLRYLRSGLAKAECAGQNPVDGWAGGTLTRNGGLEQFRQAVRLAWTHGWPVDLTALFPAKANPVPLPSYPWRRTYCYAEPTPECQGFVQGRWDHPLLGMRLPGQSVWEQVVDLESSPWLGDHKVGEAVYYPAAAYVEMGLAAARLTGDEGKPAELVHTAILRPVILQPRQPMVLRTEVQAADGEFRILSRPYMIDEPWTLHCKGRIGRSAALPQVLDGPQDPEAFGDAVDAGELYRLTARCNMSYGPVFRPVERCWRRENLALARFAAPALAEDGSLPPSEQGMLVPPPLCDGGLQLIFLVLGSLIDECPAPRLPHWFDRCILFAPGRPSYALFRKVRASRATVVCRISLLDDSGREIMRLEGGQARTVERLAAPAPHAYATWAVPQPHPLDGVPAGLPSQAALAEELGRLCGEMAEEPAWRRRCDEILPLREACALALAKELGQGGARGACPPELACLLAERLEAFGQDVADSLPSFADAWRTLFDASPESPACNMLLADAGAALLEGGSPTPGASPLWGEYARLEHGASGRLAARALELCAAGAGSPLRILAVQAAPASLAPLAMPCLGAHSRVLAASGDAAMDDLRHALAGLAQRPGDAPFELVRWDAAREDPPLQAHVAVACHCLHEAADVGLALRRLRRALAAGGRLVLAETAPNLAEDLVFGQLSSWWEASAPSDGAQAAASRLLEPGEWMRALESAGFKDIELVRPDEGSPEFVILAEAAPEAASDAASVATPDAVPGAVSESAGPADAGASTGPLWLLCQDEGMPALVQGLLDQLAERLADSCIRLAPGAKLRRQGAAWTLQPGNAEHWKAVWQALAASGRPIVCVDAMGLAGSGLDWREADAQCQALVQLARGWDAAGRPSASLRLLTLGALPAADGDAGLHPAQACALGAARVLMNEMPALEAWCIDLHPGADACGVQAQALQEILHPTAEREVLLDGARRLVLRSGEAPSWLAARREGAAGGAFAALQLECQVPGRLETLAWLGASLPLPGPGQVRVAARAVGLNFRDVMWAMNMLPEEALVNGFSGPGLGIECAGVVDAVGAGVEGLAPGDPVLCFGPRCFASHVLTTAEACAPLPAGWSFAEAATVPVAFFTAWYALHTLARLQPGERLLVHGAAGGVGLAAVQIAASLGAEVYATAGSPAKRRLLRLLGVAHIYDSRSLSFRDAILEDTGGEGLDCVLNSLAGEGMDQSLRLLRPFGRFLELGKRDFYADSPLRLRPFRDNVSFFGVDVDQLMKERPALGREVFGELMERFAQGEWRPLPHAVYPAAEAEAAFRAMQQSRHVGKVVVVPPLADQAQPGGAAGALEVRGDASYLVAGGTAGFGLACARRLAERGAGALVLVSRRGATPQSAAGIEALRSLGLPEGQTRPVVAIAQDVAEGEALAAKLDAALAGLPPLAGIVHTAAVLDDASLARMTPERLARVLRPKVEGAFSLHRWSLGRRLDFFVMFSSATTLLGNPGQANYVAANMALESLAALRRAQGLPGLAVGWGAIGDAGMLLRDERARESLSRVAGITPLSASDALDALERLPASCPPAPALFAVDWRRLSRLPLGRTPRFERLRIEGAEERQDQFLADAIRGLAPEAQLARVAEALTAAVARILRVPPSSVKQGVPLAEMGMDSLMAMELGSAIEEMMDGRPLAGGLSAGASIRDVAARVHQALTGQEGDQAQDAAGARRDAMESRHSVALNDQLADEVLSEVEARHGQQG